MEIIVYRGFCRRRLGFDSRFFNKRGKLSISTVAFKLDELLTLYKFDVIDCNNLKHEGIKTGIDRDGKFHISIKPYLRFFDI